MIRVHFSPEDLAEIRFAFSPTWELVISAMKALENPAKHALHLPWVQEARTAIDGRTSASCSRSRRGRITCPTS
ncbi:MAG TPA: hypothetical protein VJZ98_00255 [Actinomycetota bacterium]|nr:hypothetical protein [Actinomycetota bacterium]